MKKGNKVLFLNPSSPAWIITNFNGAQALKLCNGKRTVSDIIKKISSIVNRDTTEEIHKFFQEVVSESNFFTITKQESIIPKPYHLHTVHLNLTNKCNLKCIYCYADERDKKESELDSKDYLSIIDSINNLSRNVEIVLTGGEPLLSSYALHIAEYAKSKNNQLHLLSNGLLINKENVKQIADLFDLVKISLDGSNSTIHDLHRGIGSYDKTLEAIDLLIQNSATLQISMTVTKKNIGDIENMANKFGALLSFAPLFKAGRAKNKNNLAITGKEYYAALSSINGVNPLSYLCSSLERAKNQRIVKCAIGDAEISISPAGDVYPCHLLHLPQFCAGNIRTQPLETIYEDSLILKSCRNLLVSEIKGCKKCDIRFICGGACRARAFYEKNKIDVSGDFCEYEKLAFINGLFELHDF